MTLLWSQDVSADKKPSTPAPSNGSQQAQEQRELRAARNREQVIDEALERMQEQIDIIREENKKRG
jgi:hypothetical protein